MPLKNLLSAFTYCPITTRLTAAGIVASKKIKNFKACGTGRYLTKTSAMIGNAMSLADKQLANAPQFSDLNPRYAASCTPSTINAKGKLESPNMANGSYIMLGTLPLPIKKTHTIENIVTVTGGFKIALNLKFPLRFLERKAGPNDHMSTLKPIRKRNI